MDEMYSWALGEIRPRVHIWRLQLAWPLMPWKWCECGWTCTCTKATMESELVQGTSFALCVVFHRAQQQMVEC